MVIVTRISGSLFVLNAALSEATGSAPATVIFMVDGRKYVVLERN